MLFDIIVILLCLFTGAFLATLVLRIRDLMNDARALNTFDQETSRALSHYINTLNHKENL